MLDYSLAAHAQAERQEHADFEAVYTTHYPLIRSYIGGYTRCLRDHAAIADDLTADTFVKAWRYWTPFHETGPNDRRRWLYRIAKNVWLDYARHINLVDFQVWNRTDLLPDQLKQRDRWRSLLASPWDTPEHAAEIAELRHTMEAAIALLPPLYREAVQIRDFQGETYEAAAVELGITISAFKSRLWRARQLLAANPALVTYAESL